MNRIECFIVNTNLSNWLAKILKLQESRNIIFLNGKGMCNNSFLDLFNLEDNDRVIAFTCVDQVRKPMIDEMIERKLKKKNTGINFQLGFEGEESMKQNDLVVTVVNNGVTEKVMGTARKFGATGGTVISARGTGKEFASFLGMTIDSEKEILLCVTNADKTEAVAEGIQELVKNDEEVSGICFSMPIQNFYGINVGKTKEEKEKTKQEKKTVKQQEKAQKKEDKLKKIKGEKV